ncbi:hypothetical protein I5729_01420 [Acinetobacter bereziniae]|uniref:hypothetical protein n=1 Tax=Acinetobacter bereziniae TaxID=106648 RepID=UPI00190267B9|nr:hypothetical protein [Acinetobacter bereziniae]MBJ9947775.1 hypothetical protein [Acinetobacter bereziniae]
MTIKFSEKDQVVTVYSYDSDMIFCGSFEYKWLKDTGLAANSTDIKPPKIPKSKIAVFDLSAQKWSIVNDFRNMSAYSIIDQSEVKIDYVGDVKEGFTLLKPNSIYETWLDNAWVDQRTEEKIISDEIAILPPLTRRQFRLALVQNDFDLSYVEEKIKSIDDKKQQQIIQIEWEDAQTFERTSTSLNVMADILDLDDQKINELWQYAMTL